MRLCLFLKKDKISLWNWFKKWSSRWSHSKVICAGLKELVSSLWLATCFFYFARWPVDMFSTYICLSSPSSRMKLESASTSSLEDRVKRNIYSLQRTSIALEKNFMKRWKPFSLADFPEFSREAADPLTILFIRVKSSGDLFHRCQTTTVQSDSPPLIPEIAAPLRPSVISFMGPSATFAGCRVDFDFSMGGYQTIWVRVPLLLWKAAPCGRGSSYAPSLSPVWAHLSLRLSIYWTFEEPPSPESLK